VPVVQGVVLDTLALASVKEIDRENLLCVVEPGVITGRLHELVEAEGLFYPPDPNSLESCALGGNVAENAGGPRAFKYGVTRDYVLGLEAVTMDGTRLRTGKRTVKGVTGYDVTALLVGSEGTLAVFTEATLRLIPRPPEVRTLLALFRTPVEAGAAVSAIVAAGLLPRCLELLDRECCAAVRESGKAQIPEAAGALLIIEVDGEGPALEAQMERVGGACADAGALEVLVARHGGDRAKLWQARRAMSHALRARARFKLSEDIVVPRSKLGAMLARVEQIGAAHGLRLPAYGHAGDGNLHVNFLWDDASERARVEHAIEEVFRTTVAFGGTLTGEHGLGVLKMPYLPLEQSEELIELQRRIKGVFDPRGLLNPGKMFPPRGHRVC
jgi:glycolate oxidase